MRLSLFKFMCISFVFLCFIGMVGCVSNKSNGAKTSIPVRWSSGYTMPALLASSGISVNNIDDLSELITSSWYAEVDVKQTKVGRSVFNSCMDYFDKAGPSTRTIRDHEMSAYLEFKIMCEATRLLINASNSKESFLPEIILDKDVPKIFPKAIALQISTEESRQTSQTAMVRTWADVTPMIRVETHSKTKSTYFHEGGYQEVEILGYGDDNNDDVEDVFIVVRDYVTGGNYFNIRLFVLSIDSKGDWELIKEI